MLALAASGKGESTICESAFVHSAMIHEPVLNKLNIAIAKKYPYPQLNFQPKHAQNLVCITAMRVEVRPGYLILNGAALLTSSLFPFR